MISKGFLKTRLHQRIGIEPILGLWYLGAIKSPVGGLLGC
jgi:hypothetical protein